MSDHAVVRFVCALTDAAPGPVIEWLYTWFWNTLLDWIFSLPMILHQTLKALVSTWLGFFILRNIKKWQ